MRSKTIFRYSLLSALLGAYMTLPAISFGQESEADVVTRVTDSLMDYQRSGWHPRLKFNGNFALGHSENVPGNNNGTSVQLGTMLNATADYLGSRKNHEWTNSLLWELGYSKTPVVDVWIKSIDQIDFRTAYLYHLPKLQWAGPFFSLRLTTSLLPSYVVKSDPVREVRLGPGETIQDDGLGNPVNEAGTRYEIFNHGAGAKIDLTDAFAPLTLRQTLGMFAKPLTKSQITLDSRLGLGAWETFVQGGYLVEDDNDNWLALRQMEDSVQLGIELSVIANGMFREELLSYRLSALFMAPFADNMDNAPEGAKRINMEFEAALGVNVTKYVNISYSFKAYKQPFITGQDWQIQNSLLIGIGFDLIGNPPPVVEEAVPCDCSEEVATAVEEAKQSFASTNAEATVSSVEPAATEAESADPAVSEPSEDVMQETTDAGDSSDGAASSDVPADGNAADPAD